MTLDTTLETGGSVGIYLSDNHGLDWKPIGTLERSGRQTIDLSASILHRYDYRLRVLLDGAGTCLTAIAFWHDFQHSQRPLPALDRGKNTITFSTSGHLCPTPESDSARLLCSMISHTSLAGRGGQRPPNFG